MRRRVKKNKPMLIALIIINIFFLSTIIYIARFSDDAKELFKADKNYKESKNIFNEISYNISNKFELKKYDAFMEYKYHENDINCSIQFWGYKKSNNLFNTFKEKMSIEGEINELDINGRKVLYFNTKNSNNKNIYYYAFESTNRYYILIYSISDDVNGDRDDLNSNLCYKSKDEILNSINLK